MNEKGNGTAGMTKEQLCALPELDFMAEVRVTAKRGDDVILFVDDDGDCWRPVVGADGKTYKQRATGIF